MSDEVCGRRSVAQTIAVCSKDSLELMLSIFVVPVSHATKSS